MLVQGTSQSMPWLAELVQSSEGSLDVLPVQCLCEFLLLDKPTENAKSKDDDSLREQQEKRLVSVALLLQIPQSEVTSVSVIS